MICPDSMQEQILGDLEERYWDARLSKTTNRALLIVSVQAIKFLHPYFLCKRKSNLNSTFMGLLINYVKTTRRTLLRNPLHTGINVLGLAIGITACLAIFTILSHDYSYNTQHPAKERIFRIYSEFSGAFVSKNKGVPKPLGDYVKENFTGLQSIAQFHTYEADVEIPQDDGSLKELDFEDHLIIAEPGYFEVTPYEWIIGSKEVLESAYNVVLIESQARKYFADIPLVDIIGKSIIYQDSLEMKVSGIVKDLSYNSDFGFTDILSYNTINSSWLKDDLSSDWGSTSSSSQLFIKLNKGTPLESIRTLLVGASETANVKGETEDWHIDFNLQPLSDLHFNSEIDTFDNTSYTADLGVLKTLSVVAIAILLIAVINFVNLETAVSIRRSREVGVRKVLGSTKTQLIFHFLNESYLVTFIAFVISLPLVNVVLNLFAEFIPEGVYFNFLSLTTFLQLFATFILIGALAGIYPSLVLASLSTNRSLNNKIGQDGKKAGAFAMRRILTVFQFGFSQVLIIITIIAALQVNFMLNKDLGFSYNNVLYFFTPYFEEASKKDVLNNKLATITGIDQKLIFKYPPIQKGWNSSVTKFITDDGQVITNSVYKKGGDSTYMDFFGMHLLAGRKARTNNTETEVVINQTYAKLLGFEEYSKLLGQHLYRSNDTLTIVGIVKDIHFRSLHHQIDPMEITVSNSGRGFGIKMTDNAVTREVITKIEDAYKSVYPERVFSSFYMEETKEDYYKGEQQTLRLAIVAMLIAILISCLGLFGLASYETVQRTKEIGIRKVLGSSVGSIVGLLTGEFLKYVTLALLIAIPIGFFLSSKWLDDFAYSINISPWVFIATGLATWLIAFLTVSYQSIQAAVKNPVESLRYE
jgi:putative ABC transport system permease protein